MNDETGITLSTDEGDDLIGCAVYTVHCTCRTIRFQWCDGGLHNPNGPIAAGLDYCCEACGDCFDTEFEGDDNGQ